MSKKLLLIGGGGHANSVIDSIYSLNDFDEIGIVVNDLPKESNILGIKVVGSDDDLDELKQQGFHYAFVSVGSIGDTNLRKHLSNKLESKGFIIPNIIDKTAIVSDFSSIGKGNFIGKNSIVNANAELGDFTIINTSTIVEHDCKIGSFVHLSPGCVLSGGAKIGSDSHIGANSTVKQGITVGNNTLIGMGSVVVQNISDNMVGYGNPCKEVKNK